MRMSRRMGLYGGKKKYTWAKYNVASTITYQWDVYSCSGGYQETKTTITSPDNAPLYFTTTNKDSYYYSSSKPSNSNGVYTLSSSKTSSSSSASSIYSTLESKYWHTSKSTSIICYGCQDSSHNGTKAYYPIESYTLSFSASKLTKGSKTGTISNTSSSAYPSNSYKGSGSTPSGYKWYVSTGSTTTYSKGSTSYGTVTDTDPDAYPTNGQHTDGYWYVLQ